MRKLKYTHHTYSCGTTLVTNDALDGLDCPEWSSKEREMVRDKLRGLSGGTVFEFENHGVSWCRQLFDMLFRDKLEVDDEVGI